MMGIIIGVALMARNAGIDSTAPNWNDDPVETLIPAAKWCVWLASRLDRWLFCAIRYARAAVVATERGIVVAPSRRLCWMETTGGVGIDALASVSLLANLRNSH